MSVFEFLNLLIERVPLPPDRRRFGGDSLDFRIRKAADDQG